jgi:tRNA 2-thiouridine synthesizing protein B
MLHIVNQPNVLESCLRLAQADHAILLIEGGVLAACSPGEALAQPGKFYALKPDVIARGLLDKVSPNVQLIDYEGFVDLVTQYNPIQSWN